MPAAVEMCRLAVADGIDALVLTPHQRHDRWLNSDRAALESLRRELEQITGGTPRLLLGAEVAVDSDLLAEVDLMPDGSLLPLAGSGYLLLEFPMVKVGPAPRDIVHEVLLAGFHPIIAHPERTPWLADDAVLLQHLVERGARLQLTAMSVTGGFGPRAQYCAHRLIERGLVHFIASDAHDPRLRPPVLSEARRLMTDRFGADLANKLTHDNPESVLANRPLA